MGLIGWKEVDEVQPYYCEGLIHLNAMFDSKILIWENEKLSVDLSNTSYENLKSWYINEYTNLAQHYLDKKDASIFLNRFDVKEDKYFMPINKTIHSFVNFYFKRYQEIGQQIDTNDKKENYLNSSL